MAVFGNVPKVLLLHDANQRYNVMDQPIRKVIILGSGSLKIGEASESDDAGLQVFKAMRKEGIRAVWRNLNFFMGLTRDQLEWLKPAHLLAGKGYHQIYNQKPG